MTDIGRWVLENPRTLAAIITVSYVAAFLIYGYQDNHLRVNYLISPDRSGIYLWAVILLGPIGLAIWWVAYARVLDECVRLAELEGEESWRARSDPVGRTRDRRPRWGPAVRGHGPAHRHRVRRRLPPGE